MRNKIRGFFQHVRDAFYRFRHKNGGADFAVNSMHPGLADRAVRNGTAGNFNTYAGQTAKAGRGGRPHEGSHASLRWAVDELLAGNIIDSGTAWEYKDLIDEVAA